jgi:hypothetical protein
MPADSLPFLQLSHFENLLSSSNRAHSDHVFHSVRVFLIGCIILDKFYDKFHRYYCDILNASNINVEYIWLLSSLFHDIGRIYQDTWRLYLADQDEDDEDFKESVSDQMNKRWQKKEYIIALGNLAALILQSQDPPKKRDNPFTGYALGGRIDENIGDVLVNHYNRLHHGAVSCFELATSMLEKLAASNTRGKTFPLYHMFPAVLAIAFHDWKIWDDLRNIKVMPIKMRDFPLAALLIYIDTWDDYKRTDARTIVVDDLKFSDKGVDVHVTWLDNAEYAAQKIKYESFVKNVLFDEVILKITITNDR